MTEKKEVVKNEDAAAKELGADQVDAAIAEEQEKGLRGDEVDPTPNENYTVRGVTSGAPTPETDEKTALEARAHLERKRVR